MLARLALAGARIRDAVRAKLWPLPAAGVGLALLLGVLLPWLDARVDANLPPAVTAYLFGGGASAARAVLGAVASSLITVTSLTFSLTVVTLQLASSQFSPRLLRTFTQDRFVHVTLALFLGTFTYALTVLRTVRDSTEALTLFVPQVSVTVAFVLALSSVLGLVLFLAHLAQQIRVETMLRSVHRDATATLQRVLRGRGPVRRVTPEALPVPPSTALALPAARSGFLVQIDEAALLSAAIEADAVLLLDRYPGSTLVAGTPLGCAWPRVSVGFDEETAERLCTRVGQAVKSGFERTQTQDIGYGLRQLTDVSSKALSPGVNDPTTAGYALGHLSALLCELAACDLGPRLLHDEDDRLRVALPRPDLAELLEVAISQPRRYGAGDPFVVGRLFALLREVAWAVQQPTQRTAVAEQLARLRDTVRAQDFDATEQARLADLGELVERALAGNWPVARQR